MVVPGLENGTRITVLLNVVFLAGGGGGGQYNGMGRNNRKRKNASCGH